MINKQARLDRIYKLAAHYVRKQSVEGPLTNVLRNWKAPGSVSLSKRRVGQLVEKAKTLLKKPDMKFRF